MKSNASTQLLSVRRLSANESNFSADLTTLTAWSAVADHALDATVRDILDQVRSRGDSALVEFTAKFDRFAVSSMAELTINRETIQQALVDIDPAIREALEQAAQRIDDFHQRQKQESWQYTDDTGTLLGQKVTALQRVGIYVPGGKAAYPSSVLMNAIPAKVAGVKEIIMVTPTPAGEVNQTVLAAAAVAGVDTIFSVGGGIGCGGCRRG